MLTSTIGFTTCPNVMLLKPKVFTTVSNNKLILYLSVDISKNNVATTVGFETFPTKSIAITFDGLP